MKWSILIAVGIATLGFIPLMGIPGAIVIGIGDLLASLFGYQLLCMTGDRALPHGRLLKSNEYNSAKQTTDDNN